MLPKPATLTSPVSRSTRSLARTARTPLPKVPDSGQFPLPDQVGAFVLPRRMRLQTLDAWNLAVQREITPTLALSAA
jgi:hypothetical protein